MGLFSPLACSTYQHSGSILRPRLVVHVRDFTDTHPVFGPESPIPAPPKTRYYSTRSTMTARGRPAYTALPPMPLSELPMMKALLALIPGHTGPNPSAKGDPKAQFTMLRLAIIDKLQVLALRRPQALVVVARLLDALLDEQLKVLGEPFDPRSGAGTLPPRRATRPSKIRRRATGGTATPQTRRRRPANSPVPRSSKSSAVR